MLTIVEILGCLVLLGILIPVLFYAVLLILWIFVESAQLVRSLFDD